LPRSQLSVSSMLMFVVLRGAGLAVAVGDERPRMLFALPNGML
jgi:hypothetical protein